MEKLFTLRKFKLFFVFTFIAALANTAFANTKTCQHDSDTFRCVKYLKNYDGDTINFNIPDVHPLFGKNISVRIRHVDTPEVKGQLPCEKEASRTAKRLVENKLKLAKNIELKNLGRDKYFRILADVYVDGINLAESLFKNNLAYRYEGDTKQKIDWCKRLPATK